MTVARTLKENHWVSIKTRYESGEPIRQIAKDIGISHTTIMNHAKKHGWTLEIAKQLTVIKSDIQKMKQVATSEQLDIIGNAIKQEVDTVFELAKHISNLQKGAINLHGMILRDTINKTKTGEISGSEASRIAQSQGLSVKDIANMSGISKERPQSAVQINNESKADKVSINIIGVE